jgi:hypothetical protein
MDELTHDEALRRAAELVDQAVKETEARCRVLAQFISDCEEQRSRTAAWSDALRELNALHRHRDLLKRRLALISEALDCVVGERPAESPLLPPDRTVLRTQQQAQIQVQRRRS